MLSLDAARVDTPQYSRLEGQKVDTCRFPDLKSTCREWGRQSSSCSSYRQFKSKAHGDLDPELEPSLVLMIHKKLVKV